MRTGQEFIKKMNTYSTSFYSTVFFSILFFSSFLFILWERDCKSFQTNTV